MARRVRIQQLPNGQIVITVPKALAEAIGFRKGEEVQWSSEKEALVLRRITRKREGTTMFPSDYNPRLSPYLPSIFS